MSLHHDVRPASTASTRAAVRHSGFRVTEWALGIVGAIATFLGVFVLFGADDQYIGLGGDLSWRVGDLDAMWGYGLIAGGVLAMAGCIALLLVDRRHVREEGPIPESGWGDVVTHAAAFVIVNGFLWAQDLALGDGANYAYWVTIPWGVGLAAHIVAEYRASRARDHPAATE